MKSTDEKFQVEGGKIKTFLFPTETQKSELKACSQLPTMEAEASPFPSSHVGSSKPLQSQ